MKLPFKICAFVFALTLHLLTLFTFAQTPAPAKIDSLFIGLRMSNGRVRNLWFKRLPDDFGTEKPPVANK